MLKNQYPDPLKSDRTLNTSRIDMTNLESEPNPTDGSISLYDAFSFSRAGTSKIAAKKQTTRLRNLKGNLTIKNHNIFELMKMLALCENRYKIDANKLTRGIARTIFVNNVGIVGLIAKLKPLIKISIQCIKSTYLFK